MRVFSHALRRAVEPQDERTSEIAVVVWSRMRRQRPSPIAAEARCARPHRRNKVGAPSDTLCTSVTMHLEPPSSTMVRLLIYYRVSTVRSAPNHIAPPRSTPRSLRPRNAVGWSGMARPPLGPKVPHLSASRERTERVSSAPGGLNVSSGIARIARSSQIDRVKQARTHQGRAASVRASTHAHRHQVGRRRERDRHGCTTSSMLAQSCAKPRPRLGRARWRKVPAEGWWVKLGSHEKRLARANRVGYAWH